MSKSVAQVVKERIAQQRPDLADRWEHNYIQSRPDDSKLPPVQQLQAVNHYLRVQLGSLPVDTIDERECLTTDGSVNDWVRDFEQCVLPTMLEHNLPK